MQNFIKDKLILVESGEEKCLPLHTYGYGSRAFYLIHYVVSGKGTLFANGKRYDLTSGQSFIIGPKRAGYGIIYDLEADIKYNDIKANILKAIDFMNGNIIVKTIYLNRYNGEIIAFDDRNKTKKLVWNNAKSDFIESLYYE